MKIPINITRESQDQKEMEGLIKTINDQFDTVTKNMISLDVTIKNQINGLLNENMKWFKVIRNMFFSSYLDESKKVDAARDLFKKKYTEYNESRINLNANTTNTFNEIFQKYLTSSVDEHYLFRVKSYYYYLLILIGIHKILAELIWKFLQNDTYMKFYNNYHNVKRYILSLLVNTVSKIEKLINSLKSCKFDYIKCNEKPGFFDLNYWYGRQQKLEVTIDETVKYLQQYFPMETNHVENLMLSKSLLV